MRKLAANYGAHSAWAAANKDRPKAVEHARVLAEDLIRNVAKTMHAEAQQNEKATKVVDKERYARAAEAYDFYLANFPDAADAAELRYLRADILYFKLGRYEDAGRRVPRGRQDRSRSASTTRTRSCRRWARSRRCASRSPAAASARSTECDRQFGEAARPLRHAVPQGQGDRDRHLQERPALLRLRRLRRGDQALRPHRRALPRRSQRGRGRRPHPAGAQQGEELREHRELGAPAQEDQGLRRPRRSRSASTS